MLIFLQGKSAVKACSNGVCIPEPTDLNAQAPYSRYNESKPFINKIASINVEIPVIVSPIIIRFFVEFIPTFLKT